MTYERWYDFWTAFFRAVRRFVELLIVLLQELWAWLPKEAKVSLYMFGAVVLDNWARSVQPEALTMIPVTYRILAFNLFEVFMVETVKRIRAAANPKQDGAPDTAI